MTTVAVIPETALLDSRERLLVSPAYGRVTLPAPASYTSEGEVVRAGDVLAVVNADGNTVEVCAPCDAWVIDYLIRDGKRVEPGSAIAHLRAL
jgi:biotin carboxyl carrier protein